MTHNHNVVDLNKARTSSDSSSKARTLPAPLLKVRDNAVGQLKTLLRQLFDNADDALFELADKAGSNGEQAKYFDAMRELRLQRKQIALLMLQAVVRSFNHVGHFKLSTTHNTEAPSSLESLSLVQNDELEERVAIEGMVSKTRSACGQSLDHYEMRVHSLLPDIELDQAHTPGSPDALIHGFVDGCKDLQIDIAAKLVVFKLFERYVLSESDKIYQKANQALVADGVMPDLKQVRQNSRQTRSHTSTRSRFDQVDTPKSGATLDGETGEVLEEEPGLFENLREMLNANVNGHSNSRVYPGQGATTSMAASEVSREQLLTVLSGVQHSLPMAQSDGTDVGLMNFRALLVDRMGASGIEKPKLKQIDEDVINLVSMLFEFILDDRQLQPTMKALIARLQIPMLKVAMLDRNFFNKGGHPARKLLNEIATAAIGWNEKPEGQRDPLKEKVEYIVQHLLDDFENDFSVFESLLDEFTRFQNIENRRGQLVEQRTRDAEEGRAKNETSKSQVQQAIADIIGMKNVPEAARTLLEEGWGQYLSLTYLKYGEQSTEWANGLAVASDLVWSVCPDNGSPDARTKLLKLIPGLLKRLRAGLAEASYDPFKANELLKSLEGLHVDALQKLAVQPVQASNSTIENRLAAPFTESERASERPASIEQTDHIVNRDLAGEQRDVDVQAPVASLLDQPQEVHTEVVAPLKGLATSEPEVSADLVSSEIETENKESTVTSVEQSSSVAEEAVVDAAIHSSVDAASTIDATSTIDETACLSMLESLRVGSWLELQQDTKKVRCKLAAIIRVTGKYIFVDRSGIKIAENNKEELLNMIRKGAVNILNDGLLFDRALESVIDNLRHSRRD